MNRIKHFRKQVKLSQLAAAKAAGWGYQSRWSQYERGERTVDIPTGRMILRVLKDHGAKADDGAALTLDDVFPPAENSEAA